MGQHAPISRHPKLKSRLWLANYFSSIAACVALLLPLGLLLSSTSIHAQERVKTWEERFSFEKGGKDRPGLYRVDPNVWAYSAEFAKRFGMPAQWIDPQLQGVEAIAWRRVPEQDRTCGWGGNKDACRQEFKCEMDFYIDESKTPLPWAKDAKPMDDLRTFASTYFLSPEDGAQRRPKSALAPWQWVYGGQRRSPFADPQTGKEVFLHGNYPVGGNSPLNGSITPDAWERGLYGPLTVLVRDGAFCFGGTAIKDIRYRIGDADEGMANAKPRSWVEILVPKGFMERVREAKQVFEAKDREFYQRALNNKKGE